MCRIDIKGIKAHAWFSMPMREGLQKAAQKLETEQAAINGKVAAGAYHSQRRDKAISNLIKLAASDEFRKRVRDRCHA